LQILDDAKASPAVCALLRSLYLDVASKGVNIASRRYIRCRASLYDETVGEERA